MKRLVLHLLLVAALVATVSFALAAAPPGGYPQTAPVPGPSPTGGLAPLPNDERVPTRDLPPGSFDDDPGPSDVIFPAQKITIRFNHRFHVQKQGMSCKQCHAGAYSSATVNERLTPKGNVCDDCHGSNHDDLANVKAGRDPESKCAYCHLGYKDADGNLVARMELPRANMVFSHRAHLDRNIQCAQCHGEVENVELATRDQLPRMRGCFHCHQMTDSASAGDAKSDCQNCHLRGVGTEAGRMKTMFASGQLVPPRWLGNAAHTPDWIDRHKQVAGANSELCASCHSEDYCTACHDGRVRPRSIHPNDYISMHPIDARQEATKCTSCHREQSFCLDCHMRVGVSMSSPTEARESGRFHPPKSIWSDPPRKPGHHAFEAERNLNACVSCHIERDCVVCHGGQGIGGGFNPHRNGFAAGCSTQFRRNPRPCFVCHEPNAAELAQCR